MVLTGSPHVAATAAAAVLQPCLPDWTFQPSALQALWLQPLSGLDDQAELDWSLLLPQYSPSLVPLVEGAAVAVGRLLRQHLLMLIFKIYFDAQVQLAVFSCFVKLCYCTLQSDR
jgi:hypothetical protein